MNGYNEIREALKASPPSLNSVHLAPILHNLIYYLTDDDMAIRAQTSSTFSFVLKAISEKESLYPKSLLTQLVIPGLKRKLTGKNNFGRNEAITLFGQIVSNFPNLYPDLHALITSGYSLTSGFNSLLSNAFTLLGVYSLFKSLSSSFLFTSVM